MMNFRLFISIIASFIFSILYNILIHMIILVDANKQVETLKRTDFSSKVWLSLLGTLVVLSIFSIIYSFFIKRKDVRTGVLLGFLFGALAVIFVDLNQYVLYPLPLLLVGKWSFFGIVEFICIGFIVGIIMKEKT